MYSVSDILPNVLSYWDSERSVALEAKEIGIPLSYFAGQDVLLQICNDSLIKCATKRAGIFKDATRHDCIEVLHRALSGAEFDDPPVRFFHQDLYRFYGAGSVLEDFQQRFVIPIKVRLLQAGFIWHSCWPAFFCSVNGAHSSFHFDTATGLFLQLCGSKNFWVYPEPGQIASPRQILRKFSSRQAPPKKFFENAVALEVKPGDGLWNPSLAPHWVQARTRVAASVTLFFCGLSRDGEITRPDKELREYWDLNPVVPWLTEFRHARY